jgi:hypothetical protein
MRSLSWSRCLLLACFFSFISTLFLASCGGGSSGTPSTPSGTTLTVSPQLASIPVNGTQLFTATTNAPSNTIVWSLPYPTGQGLADVGKLTAQSSPTTVLYTAPPAPPMISYTVPGTVVVRAIADSSTSSDQSIVITAPSVTVGFYNTTTTMPLGSTILVWAYAIGSTNNALTLQVNGITGGSTSTGTIAVRPPIVGGSYGMYNYIAPTSMPMTGDTITITAVSQADPTKTANLIVTLK